MNMLIIGNGFDIAHKLPTRYGDFLKFAKQIVRTKNFCGTKDKFESMMPDLHTDVKKYVLSAFDTRQNLGSGNTRNGNGMIQELYECLDKNVWYEYFLRLYNENEIHGINWIDFEGEIREVIEFFDHEIDDIYEHLSASLTSAGSVPDKICFFCKKLDLSDKNTYCDLIKKTYQDLEKLIRCLEIYLADCVGRIEIANFSPDIRKLEVDFVLSFNYTAIPTQIYQSLNTTTHHIHGRADSNRPAKHNNMVMGVNEYWDAPEKNFRTNFNAYKKFVQRIIKETGIDYKEILDGIRRQHNALRSAHGNREIPNHNHVYIFGHSLDVTDGDILREIIQTPGVVTTIFYRNKQQQSNQIANLSKVLGQDELLERVFSTSPSIIFEKQAKMLPRAT